jgi:hypothetical protein
VKLVGSLCTDANHECDVITEGFVHVKAVEDGAREEALRHSVKGRDVLVVGHAWLEFGVGLEVCE